MYTDILKELRRDKNLTQADMAAYFNIKQSMYSMYESGRRTMKIEMLCMLADILDTSTDYILGRTSVEEPYPKR
ncbi:MAG: helix-turn-helix transcriptional regulator [Clostridia bacterium]|nr:helix-turn-helix transcriptional regulator [Clostridia bacterium]